MAHDLEKQEKLEETWRPATRMVRGGTRRSAYGETNEAMFLTSGFVYDTAAEAEAEIMRREEQAGGQRQNQNDCEKTSHGGSVPGAFSE